MNDFDTAVSHFGESSVQAILEDWERVNKIKHSIIMTLEQRWAIFWNSVPSTSMSMAA